MRTEQTSEPGRRWRLRPMRPASASATPPSPWSTACRGPSAPLFHVPHGISNAMLITECLTCVLDGCYPRFADIARTIGAADSRTPDASGGQALHRGAGEAHADARHPDTRSLRHRQGRVRRAPGQNGNGRHHEREPVKHQKGPDEGRSRCDLPEALVKRVTHSWYMTRDQEEPPRRDGLTYRLLPPLFAPQLPAPKKPRFLSEGGFSGYGAESHIETPERCPRSC